MTKTLRPLVFVAMIGAAGLLASAPPASARPIRGPHASFSVAIGSPFFFSHALVVRHPIRYGPFGDRFRVAAPFCGFHRSHRAFFSHRAHFARVRPRWAHGFVGRRHFHSRWRD